MLLALTDHLRCTAAHEASVLVARADVVHARRMVSGVLGCPVCRDERLVANGVVYWRPGPATAPSGAADAAGDAVIRIGALIGLADSTVPYVLCGDAGLAAAGLGGLADAPLILLDPPDDRAASIATVIRGAPRVPLAARAAHGVALDRGWAADADRVASAVAALAPRRRVVAPVDTVLPFGVREVARDDREWVAERDADVVQLGRRPAVHHG